MGKTVASVTVAGKKAKGSRCQFDGQNCCLCHGGREESKRKQVSVLMGKTVAPVTVAGKKAKGSRRQFDGLNCCLCHCRREDGKRKQASV